MKQLPDQNERSRSTLEQSAPESLKSGLRPYRFGFVLTTAAGNMTRYLNLRKYAERDPDVECVWAPISHYMEPNPFRGLPNGLKTRLIVMLQSRPVLRQMSRLDRKSVV